jgi:beta-N-acetylhexosaminidase
MRESVRKVGERFMLGFDGCEPSSDVKRLIRDYGVGNIILFTRNVDSPEQVADLVRELQECARDARHTLPLLVAVDQEGGRVARMRYPWTEWPPLQALGRTGDENLSRRMGAALAREVASCGIRLDFAPVMDVHTNPDNPVINDRAFGDDPSLVARMGAAMIQGFQDAGVAASAKHFPGHGDTDLDSHHALPSVGHSRSRLNEVELPPFRAAIAAGVATIMTVHAVIQEIDDTVPATLSPRVVRGLLRGELGYQGVVVSDDLEMKAVHDEWPPSESAVLAAKAGCDILPVCGDDHDAQVEAIEAVVRALETEVLSFSDMDDACARVRRMKERFLLPYVPPDRKAARQTAGTAEHVALAQEIAERGGVAL